MRRLIYSKQNFDIGKKCVFGMLAFSQAPLSPPPFSRFSKLLSFKRESQFRRRKRRPLLSFRRVS